MLVKSLAAAAVALTLSLPVALGAPHVAPGQRVDLKVLLISADGTPQGVSGNVPVVVTMGSTQSNSVTLPVR